MHHLREQTNVQWYLECGQRRQHSQQHLHQQLLGVGWRPLRKLSDIRHISGIGRSKAGGVSGRHSPRWANRAARLKSEQRRQDGALTIGAVNGNLAITLDNFADSVFTGVTFAVSAGIEHCA